MMLFKIAFISFSTNFFIFSVFNQCIMNDSVFHRLFNNYISRTTAKWFRVTYTTAIRTGNKNKVLSPFSWPLCFTVSFQASISFPQVQTVSTDNIPSLIRTVGRRHEELPQGNYPTFIPHLRESSLKCWLCCEYLFSPMAGERFRTSSATNLRANQLTLPRGW